MLNFVQAVTFNTQYTTIQKIRISTREEIANFDTRSVMIFPTSNFYDYASIFGYYESFNLLYKPTHGFIELKQKYGFDAAFINFDNAWYFAPNISFLSNRSLC